MADSPSIFLLLPLAFAVGAAMGSFVTLASWRLPRDEEIVVTPSHCVHCNATLKPRDLVPIFSWAFSRGRCLHCKAPVSIRYPLIELATALSFTAITALYGASLTTLLLLLLVVELGILIVTDLEHTIIPDGVQIALFFTGIFWDIRQDADWPDVARGAALGLALGLLLHYGYKHLRKKDGLGWADVKFLCVAGIWLPEAHSFVSFLFCSGVLGILTGLLWRGMKRGPLFPFGPALALALFINVVWPDLLQGLMG